MGLCNSSQNSEHKNEAQISQAIETQITKDHVASLNTIKLLLLGPGESGKSTIFKQMKIIYGQGYSDVERYEYQKFIHSNVIECMRTLCRACTVLHLQDQIQAKDEFDRVVAFTDLDCFGPNVCLTPELAEIIHTLWIDPGIQATWDQRHLIQVPESIFGYFNALDKISAFNYLPSVEDILNVRVRTSGIIEKRYNIDGNEFLLVDVGGQRNERKKWIHSFDGVDSVIFVAALSEFDQMIFEEETVNRMVEALSVFDEVCNNYFVNTPIMLFLNKKDLFQEKIKIKKINEVIEFSDFAGNPNDFDECCQYFVKKFSAINRMKKKDIFFHITCATDTKNIEFVFNVCKEVILRKNLSDGFMGFS